MKPFVIKHLRRASMYWKPKNEALSNARVSRGAYRCNCCKKIFSRKEVRADHIDPVVDPKAGFIDWNTYIERLFVPANSYQVVCIDCHQIKSTRENKGRRK